MEKFEWSVIVGGTRLKSSTKHRTTNDPTAHLSNESHSLQKKKEFPTTDCLGGFSAAMVDESNGY